MPYCVGCRFYTPHFPSRKTRYTCGKLSLFGPVFGNPCVYWDEPDIEPDLWSNVPGNVRRDIEKAVDQISQQIKARPPDTIILPPLLAKHFSGQPAHYSLSDTIEKSLSAAEAKLHTCSTCFHYSRDLHWCIIEKVSVYGEEPCKFWRPL